MKLFIWFYIFVLSINEYDNIPISILLFIEIVCAFSTCTFAVKLHYA